MAAYDDPTDTLQIYADTAEEETGTPADLIMSVIHSESSFDPSKVSKRSAVGLMQLMPVIAKKYGVTDSLDPVQNIRAGARHLGDLLKKHGGNQELALAEYHGGPKQVRGGKVAMSSNNYVRNTMQNFADPGNIRRLYKASKPTEKMPKEQVRELIR
jgi:soluble lytic murein transglycosylase-like protein